LCAGERDMAAGERECGAAVVERRGLPVAIVVALLAALPLLALVLVVLLVARVAIGRDVAEAGEIAMARIALHFCTRVAGAQLGLGGIVIELARLPVTFSVAIGTVFAKRRFVLVVLAVAADASRRRILEHRALVTAPALLRCVLAQQRETRLGVIEVAGLFPVALGVAIGACVAERALVLVVLAMAINAGGGEL